MALTEQNQTGSLTYNKVLPNGNSIPLNFSLWVKRLGQDNQLQGISAQSKNTNHFYPRSYGPGDMRVTGIAPSQHSYQELAAYIRGHQEYMNSTFSPIVGVNGSLAGYEGLLNLRIDSEGIYYYGWIKNFIISKRGVFEPAPEYQFDFTIARDNTSTNGYTSYTINKYFNDKDILIPEIAAARNKVGN